MQLLGAREEGKGWLGRRQRAFGRGRAVRGNALHTLLWPTHGSSYMVLHRAAPQVSCPLTDLPHPILLARAGKGVQGILRSSQTRRCTAAPTRLAASIPRQATTPVLPPPTGVPGPSGLTGRWAAPRSATTPTRRRHRNSPVGAVVGWVWPARPPAVARPVGDPATHPSPLPRGQPQAAAGAAGDATGGVGAPPSQPPLPCPVPSRRGTPGRLGLGGGPQPSGYCVLHS